MDRCSRCHGQLEFYGISVKPTWFRWTKCTLCGLFTAGDPWGNLMAVVKQVPLTAQFITTGEKDRR